MNSDINIRPAPSTPRQPTLFDLVSSLHPTAGDPDPIAFVQST